MKKVAVLLLGVTWLLILSANAGPSMGIHFSGNIVCVGATPPAWQVKITNEGSTGWSMTPTYDGYSFSADYGGSYSTNYASNFYHACPDGNNANAVCSTGCSNDEDFPNKLYYYMRFDFTMAFTNQTQTYTIPLYIGLGHHDSDFNWWAGSNVGISDGKTISYNYNNNPNTVYIWWAANGDLEISTTPPTITLK